MKPTLHTEGHTIVFLGAFNPQIFQPSWFAHQRLIRPDEADQATIEIIHREVVAFKTEWFRLEVLQERAVFAATQSQYYEPLRDVALGAFRILRHTPINKLGINRDIHFRMPSEEEWHALGHRLAPKEPWKGILESPGLTSLSMQGKRPDDYKGIINVKIEPSQPAKPGIFIQVNDHYEVKDQQVTEGAEEITSILEKSWSSSMARSWEIAHSIVGA